MRLNAIITKNEEKKKGEGERAGYMNGRGDNGFPAQKQTKM